MFSDISSHLHYVADKNFIFSYFIPENRVWRLTQIVSYGNKLHEMSNIIFWEK